MSKFDKNKFREKLGSEAPERIAAGDEQNREAQPEKTVFYSTRIPAKDLKEIRIIAAETGKNQQTILLEALELWKKANGY